MLDVEFIQLLQDMIGDLTSAPEPIEIKLFSQDPALLQQWAPKVADAIKKIPGVVDVLERHREHDQRTGDRCSRWTRRGGARRVHAAGNRARCQRDHAGRAGADAGRGERSRLHDPRALSRAVARSSLDAIRNTLLVSSHGRTATLGSLATVIEDCRARPRSGARTCSATSASRRGSKGSTSAPASRRCSRRSPT